MDKNKKVSLAGLRRAQADGRKIVMLTAYDHPFARILDEAGVDIVLIGDSLGNVALGYRDTLPVTMEEMVVHTRAVARGVQRALVVADMPFGSFQAGDDQAVANAVKLVKAGAEAVKIEGAGYITAIKRIIRAGIPVMGHLGFTPQSANLRGPGTRGLGAGEKKKLMSEAKALEKAGCFALVLELVEPKLAGTITRALKIPTIGIGAGKNVDGQVLVTNDLLGLYENPPGFVRPKADLRKIALRAVRDFIEN